LNRFKLRIIQIISFVLVIFPILTVSTFQAVGIARNTFTNYIINDTGMYIDGFDANTFEDPTSDVFGWGLGTLTNERNFSWSALDFYATDNVVRDIAVQGRKAYAVGFNMTSSQQSILGFNINDPSDIRLMSSRNSLSGITACDVDGDTMYAGVFDGTASSDQFSFYNICTPYNLNGGGVYMGELLANGPVTDVEAVGHLVYYTAYNDSSDRSFRIAEVSDPDNPKAITPNWVSNKSLGLAVSGHFAYIAASDDGFYILNITDKYSPAVVGHIGLPGNATDVLIEGSFAYVTLAEGGFAVVDVFNPANPVVINVQNIGGGITNHMALQGNTLFVTAGPQGVWVYDVADPFNPSFVTSQSLPYTWDVELYGGVLVVGTDDGIHTFQISAEGGGITDFSRFYYENAFDVLEAWDVRVVGDIAYVAAGFQGFYTLNVRDPVNPIFLDSVEVIGAQFRKIDVQGQFACLISPTYMSIFDISDPTNLKLITTTSGSELGDVHMYGEMIYVSWMLGGYAIINTTTPENFNFVYELDEPWFGTNITAIQAQGYHVYTVDNVGGAGVGFYIYEQIDLTNHLEIGSRSLISKNLDLIVDGDLAFHSDTDWCVITNVSDPYNSFYVADVMDNVGSFITSTGVWNFGPYIISTSPTATYLVDATDLSNFESTQYNNTGGALAVTTSGDYTYVANHSNLIILRHFESAADTYIPGAYLAQSTSIFTMANGSIDSATLVVEDYVPGQTGIEYFMSANGTNWEPVTPNVEHNFLNPGTDLQWRAVFTGLKDRSAHLYHIEISYDYTYEGGGFNLSPLWIGIIAGGGGLLLIIIIVVIVLVVRKGKKVPTR